MRFRLFALDLLAASATPAFAEKETFKALYVTGGGSHDDEKGELHRVISMGEHVATGVSGEGEGHTITHENFQVLLKNGVNWALGQTEG